VGNKWATAEVGMKGSLQELGDGHWRLRVFAGREGGKVRQVSRNFKGIKRQAESALAKLAPTSARRCERAWDIRCGFPAP
jgi:hypothetical protein